MLRISNIKLPIDGDEEKLCELVKKKYGIKAFCICREQFGTDGYTLWG